MTRQMIMLSGWVAAILAAVMVHPLAQARELPDFGLIFNDDGDLAFTSMDSERAMQNLRASIDALTGTPVRTLTYSVGAGSDVLYYPTKVASVWGWRKTKYDEFSENPRSEDDKWAQRILNVKTGMAAGKDAIRVAGQRAKELGLYFIPSYRMNDDHFMFDPFNYPLTGEFWIKHHETYTIGTDRSPILSDEHYGNLLDFSHEEVRNYRLGVIFEVIDRYQDIMDGIELDFNRVQVFFPRGTAQERAHLMTDLVAKVRQRLDQAQQDNGRPYYLLVRIPPSLRNCRWAGLDIPTWVQQGLVDVLIPAQLMTLAHDMPVDEFVALAEPAGCKVYPALYPRTSWRWPLSHNPSAADYAQRAQRQVTPALVRGAAANYWHMGASGFELFNFQHEDYAVRPYTDRVYRIMRDLASPAALSLADKVFAVTPAYYLDHEDTYQYRKQVPVALTAGEPLRLKLIVGDDLNAPDAALQPDRCALRLGFRDASADTHLAVAINDQPIFEGSVASHYLAATGRAPATAPTAYVQLPLQDTSPLRQGVNEIRITLEGPQDATVQLVECALGVAYDRQYLRMLFQP
ncbi:MAG TPA: hypothetical protein VF184_02295 [Phycisphaeraceae bacterium]